MRASQNPTVRASSVSAVTAAKAPSSCSGPRSRVNVCSGWRPKRRRCGSSAASGVAPLTCETQGPGSIAAATSAIARSGTQRSTSSGSSAPSVRPRSRRRAARAEPTRPAPITCALSIIWWLQFRRADTGQTQSSRWFTLGGMPIYEYACMECESHFDELVRSQEQAVAVPRVRRRQRAQAVLDLRGRRHHLAAEVRRAGGGGCCGGSCGSCSRPPRALESRP